MYRAFAAVGLVTALGALAALSSIVSTWWAAFTWGTFTTVFSAWWASLTHVGAVTERFTLAWWTTFALRAAALWSSLAFFSRPTARGVAMACGLAATVWAPAPVGLRVTAALTTRGRGTTVRGFRRAAHGRAG